MTTSLTRVRRSHVIYIDTVFLGLVFDVALKFTERLLLELGGVRDTLADMLQVLERNCRTVVFNGFSDKRFRHSVKVIGTPTGEPTADALDSEMCRASARLLEVAAPTFVLVAAVVEGVCVTEERSRRSDGKVAIHVQIDTENHSVLGFIVARIRFESFLHSNVEVVRAIALVERCLPFSDSSVQ